MGDIDISAGETVKIVNESQARDTWKATISGGDILVGHHKQEVPRNGDRIKAGDRVRLDNLGGSPLYAYADGKDVTVSISEAAVNITFMARTVVGSVQADDGSEVAPASGAFVHRHGVDVDPSSTVTESLEAPDRADWIVIHVEDADASFDVEVRYLEEEDSSNYTSRSYSGDSSTEVYERVAVASPFVDVVLSGSATTADYNIYAR
jgi:hypothetical protein